MKELRAVIGIVICKGSRGNTRSGIVSMKRHKSISLKSRSRRASSVFSRNYGTLLDAGLLLPVEHQSLVIQLLEEPGLCN